VLSNLLPGNDSFADICCNENAISEPLLNNGRLAPLFRLSAVTSQYNGKQNCHTDDLIEHRGLFSHKFCYVPSVIFLWMYHRGTEIPVSQHGLKYTHTGHLLLAFFACAS
jgi:hypothetical protein